MELDDNESSSCSSNEENGDKVDSNDASPNSNGCVLSPPLTQSDKLNEYLDKSSCDVDYDDLKYLSIEELNAKAEEFDLLIAQSKNETTQILEETDSNNEQIFHLKSHNELHKLMINAVGEEYDRNCKKLSALQFTYNDIVDEFSKLEILRLENNDDIKKFPRLYSDAKKLSENVLRKREREVNRKRVLFQNKTEAFNLMEEKKSVLENGLLLQEKELIDMKIRKKEALEAESIRTAKASRITALNNKLQDLREKMQQALKQKQEKTESLKTHQQKVAEKQSKANEMLAVLNEVKNKGDVCRSKIEENKANIRRNIADRFNNKSQSIDQANKNLAVKLKTLLETKAEQENMIADIRSNIENMSAQHEQLLKKNCNIQDEIMVYEDRIAAIPANNMKLVEEHDKMQSKLNQYQQNNINLKMKINSQMVEYDFQITEAKKKKQMLTKALFPDRGSTTSFDMSSESGESLLELPLKNIGIIGTPACEPPFVLKKVEVLRQNSSDFNPNDAGCSTGTQQSQNKAEKKSKKGKKNIFQ